MRKTSVYLSDEEAERLRLTAIREGRPQAELIREGVRRVLDANAPVKRVFHSMGKGSGRPFAHWTAEELYEKVMGRR